MYLRFHKAAPSTLMMGKNLMCRTYSDKLVHMHEAFFFLAQIKYHSIRVRECDCYRGWHWNVWSLLKREKQKHMQLQHTRRFRRSGSVRNVTWLLLYDRSLVMTEELRDRPLVSHDKAS
jgi:hypothetical protein